MNLLEDIIDDLSIDLNEIVQTVVRDLIRELEISEDRYLELLDQGNHTLNHSLGMVHFRSDHTVVLELEIPSTAQTYNWAYASKNPVNRTLVLIVDGEFEAQLK
jgi:hypothetical protein